MADKGSKSKLQSVSIKSLLANKVLASKVINMINNRESYSYIIKFMESQGFTTTKATLTHLKKKMVEAQETGMDVTALADKREYNTGRGTKNFKPHKVIGFTGKTPASQAKQDLKKAKAKSGPITYYSDEQVLEEIIAKGKETIANSEFVDPKTLMTALNLHSRYYGSKNRGLSAQALKQYQLINQAIVAAEREIFVRYIPKDKQQEALKELDKSEKKILNNIGATKEGRELLKNLHKADLNFD